MSLQANLENLTDLYHNIIAKEEQALDEITPLRKRFYQML